MQNKRKERFNSLLEKAEVLDKKEGKGPQELIKIKEKIESELKNTVSLKNRKIDELTSMLKKVE